MLILYSCAIPTPPPLNTKVLPGKGFCAHSAESQTLTVSIRSKVRVYLQGAKQGEQAAHAQKTRTPQWLTGEGF